MKRLTAFLCLLALICSLTFPAAAVSQPTFTPTAMLSEDGTTVTVTISATNATQICGATFDITYDSALVSCQSVSGSAALAGYSFIGNATYDTGTARAAWMGLTPMKSDSDVAVFVFKILSGAGRKTAVFTVTEASAFDETGCSLSVVPGSVSLAIPGATSSDPIEPTPEAPSETPTPPAVLTPEQDPPVYIMAFTDIAERDYYYDAVRWAVGQNITTGTSATTFSPNMTCNRAQTVTFLWRAAGCPAPAGSGCPFKDVPVGAYYYDAVCWAVEQNITTGTSAATFSPNMQVTRGQVVTFLWRAEGSSLPTSAKSPFSDVPASAYFRNAVNWAVERGITSGMSASTFVPNVPCTRAQIVTFLYRTLA